MQISSSIADTLLHPEATMWWWADEATRASEVEAQGSESVTLKTFWAQPVINEELTKWKRSKQNNTLLWFYLGDEIKYFILIF